MSAEFRLFARCPAKINLGLRVLGRREDGYHEIATLFQAIDLWDDLEARPSEGLELDCDDPAIPSDGSNLVLRAAKLLQSVRGLPGSGARLSLRKRIPSGGGLGGGSSDAAGALLLLARLWSVPAAAVDLAPLAAELGADVTFFLHGGTAIGSGRGERIEPVPFPGTLHLVLGFPPFRLVTAEVYAGLGARLTARRNDVSLPSLFPKYGSLNDFGAAVNDLEEAAFEGRPDLGLFRDALRSAGARPAMLSGSGSSVFGVFADAGTAGSARDAMAGEFREWRVITSKTVPGGVEIGEPPGEGVASKGARSWK